jgi:hypothetical protein
VPGPPEANEWISEELIAQIDRFVWGGDQNRGKAPPCDPQAPLGRFVGQPGMYPRLQPLPQASP